MTLRLQIAIALGMLAAVAAVSAALFSYASVDQRLEAETDTLLSNRISQVQAFLAARAELPADDQTLLLEGNPSNQNALGSIARYEVEMTFLLPDGSVVASTPDAVLPITQTEIDQAMRSLEAIPSQLRVDHRTFETRLVSFDARAGQRIVLQLGRDITGQLDTLDQLRFRLVLVVSAVVLAGALAGYFLASKLVRPLDKLRAATRAVADTKDFSEPITIDVRLLSFFIR